MAKRRTSKKKSTNHTGTKIGVAAAVAAAAAGAYWLYGAKNAAKHRRQVRGFALKARGEVVDAVGKLKQIDKETYLQIVEDVVGRYKGVRGTTEKELRDLVKELKGSWSHIQKSAQGKGATSRKIIRRPAKAKRARAKRKTTKR